MIVLLLVCALNVALHAFLPLWEPSTELAQAIGKIAFGAAFVSDVLEASGVPVWDILDGRVEVRQVPTLDAPPVLEATETLKPTPTKAAPTKSFLSAAGPQSLPSSLPPIRVHGKVLPAYAHPTSAPAKSPSPSRTECSTPTPMHVKHPKPSPAHRGVGYKRPPPKSTPPRVEYTGWLARTNRESRLRTACVSVQHAGQAANSYVRQLLRSKARALPNIRKLAKLFQPAASKTEEYLIWPSRTTKVKTFAPMPMPAQASKMQGNRIRRHDPEGAPTSQTARVAAWPTPSPTRGGVRAPAASETALPLCKGGPPRSPLMPTTPKPECRVLPRRLRRGPPPLKLPPSAKGIVIEPQTDGDTWFLPIKSVRLRTQTWEEYLMEHGTRAVVLFAESFEALIVLAVGVWYAHRAVQLLSPSKDAYQVGFVSPKDPAGRAIDAVAYRLIDIDELITWHAIPVAYDGTLDPRTYFRPAIQLVMDTIWEQALPSITDVVDPDAPFQKLFFPEAIAP